ncbi:hypothetical protein CDL12_02264 [Handroanthus impetiginosus]|uniref:C2H2-type domain-containing protein n=1 Tax=Handroanthus impetiginosus TaxID=429701 RepID=A0A2G9I5G5_9LAMI|nr:hypothetical protein CDL12_02264 [Handroanthus impetiginosus]
MESPDEGKNGGPSRSSEGLVPTEPPQFLEEPSMDGENMVPNEIPQLLEGSPMANPDPDREYSCKYCDKKFTNKQALGGHQNAHKVERAIEKSAREMHENPFGFGGSSVYPGLASSPYLGSYNRFHDFMNRSNMNRPPYPVQQQQQPMQHYYGYNPRPGLSIGGEGSYIPHLLPGVSSMFPGYPGHRPLLPPQFSRQPSNMPNHALNRHFSNIGEASASSSARPPLSQGLLTNFIGSRPRVENNRDGGNNNQRNDTGEERVGDSDLDLSLKL